MRLKVNEAIALAKAKGKKIRKMDIAAVIFEGTSEIGAKINMSNLCQGKTQRVKPEWVVKICEMCECSADFLFGLEEIK